MASLKNLGVVTLTILLTLTIVVITREIFVKIVSDMKTLISDAQVQQVANQGINSINLMVVATILILLGGLARYLFRGGRE